MHECTWEISNYIFHDIEDELVDTFEEGQKIVFKLWPYDITAPFSSVSRYVDCQHAPSGIRQQWITPAIER